LLSDSYFCEATTVKRNFTDVALHLRWLLQSLSWTSGNGQYLPCTSDQRTGGSQLLLDTRMEADGAA